MAAARRSKAYARVRARRARQLLLLLSAWGPMRGNPSHGLDGLVAGILRHAPRRQERDRHSPLESWAGCQPPSPAAARLSKTSAGVRARRALLLRGFGETIMEMETMIAARLSKTSAWVRAGRAQLLLLLLSAWGPMRCNQRAAARLSKTSARVRAGRARLLLSLLSARGPIRCSPGCQPAKTSAGNGVPYC